MGRRKSSPVHQFFKFNVNTGKSVCQIAPCTQEINGEHAKNLERHVQSIHYDVFDKHLSKAAREMNMNGHEIYYDQRMVKEEFISEESEVQFDVETWTPEVLIKAQNPSLTITPKPAVDNPPQVQYSIDTITQNTPSPTISETYSIKRKKFKGSTLGASTNQTFTDLAVKKLELVNLQLENTKQLHTSQMKQEAELFELRKELLKTKIELKKKKLEKL